MKAEPFVYWRWASLGATVAAIVLGRFSPYPTLCVACTIMAIGWAMCDVLAWRDLRIIREHEAARADIQERGDRLRARVDRAMR